MIVETRLRIQYTKLGKIRFVGHRDLARAWERTLHQARIPVAYSQGFTPHPKVSFGLALPVAWESVAEYLDITLAGDPADLTARLNLALPAGVRVERVEAVMRGVKSLSSVVTRATYTAWMRPHGAPWRDAFVSEAAAALASITASAPVQAIRNKKGEEIEEDIRPLIHELAIVGDGDFGERESECKHFGMRVHMTLSTQPRVLRPEEVAAAVTSRGLACEVSLVRRESQHVFVDGTAFDPMHPMVRGLAGAA